MALLVYGAVECISFAVYYFAEGAPFSFERLAELRVLSRTSNANPGATASPDGPAPKYAPHPYLGYVPNPEVTGRPLWWIDTYEDRRPLDREDVTVVITGGSVAHNLGFAGARLRKRLEALPGFAGRKVRILSTAAGGYKQPQQLLGLAFYLSSGGPLDILINLDGFNEVAALNINIQNRVHPAYPVFWWEVTRDFGGSEDLQRASALHLLRRSRSLLADAAEYLKGSVTASLIWRLSDRALERRIYTTAAELPPATEAPAFSRGPPFPSSPAEQRKRSVEIWANSSRAMQGLAESHGFAYYHFLQPNQYVRSTRVFTREEQKRALSNRNYAEIIPRWYPKLRLGGEQLERRGVAFFDLSFIFDDVEETVFDDDCCHLNPRGRRRLVDEIVKRIGMQ